MELFETRTLLYFGGCSNKDLHIQILESTERQLLTLKESKRVIRRVINVMIECLSNISHHGVTPDPNLSFFKGSVSVSSLPDHYVIVACNLMSSDDIPSLLRYIASINAMNKEELTCFYKRKLGSDVCDPGPGAGLGLIEMARRSGLDLKATENRFTSNLSLFTLQVSVPKNLNT
jgi:hypothetical protein